MKINYEKYGPFPVMVGILVYNIGYIFQIIAIPSSDWVNQAIPELPFGIAIPEGSSVSLSGGMFDVCVSVKNMSQELLVRNAIDRIKQIVNTSQEIIDILPDSFPTRPPLFPDLPTNLPQPIIDIIVDTINDFIDDFYGSLNGTINVELACFEWNALWSPGLPACIRIPKQLAVGGVTVDFMALVGYAVYGYTALVFEFCCFGTLIGLAQSLTLISSVPSMVDLYCNCHDIIGSIGWINIAGDICKISACAVFLAYHLQLRGRTNFSISKIVDHIFRSVLAICGILDLYVMFCSKLSDSSYYMDRNSDRNPTDFLINHSYGFWDICSENIIGEGEICTKWTEPRFGTWTPSQYWSDPKPLGTYYAPALLSVVIVFCFLPIVLPRDLFLNRFCYIGAFYGNCAMSIVITGLVNALPISEDPRYRNSQLTKGFYGAGWIASVTATALSFLVLLINTIFIYSEETEKSIPEKNVSEKPEKIQLTLKEVYKEHSSSF